MYNACEWGNYCRVAGHRQSAAASSAAAPSSPMRRSWCAPDSPVYTPQQLANRTIGVPFYFGTHYIALHMLEGFLPRDMIKLVPRAERLALPRSTR